MYDKFKIIFFPAVCNANAAYILHSIPRHSRLVLHDKFLWPNNLAFSLVDFMAQWAGGRRRGVAGYQNHLFAN